jgi:hypothetical protein
VRPLRSVRNGRRDVEVFWKGPHHERCGDDALPEAMSRVDRILD